MPETYTLLICTVGGTAEPIAAALKSWRPSAVIFVPSAGTAGRIPDVRALAAVEPNGFELPPDRYEVLTLPDPQDFPGCVHALRDLAGKVRGWRARGEGFEVAVDFTGGTKVMSAALALQAHLSGCRFSYVGGTERTKEGVGVVLTGTEEVRHEYNPWVTLGYQAIEEATTLFDQGAFGAAALRLQRTLPSIDDATRKRELQALKILAEAYEAWDRFDHKSAAASLREINKYGNDLRSLLTPERAEKLRPQLESQRADLEELAATKAATWLLVCDLLANALRRGAERRYDDAVARLYRAIEAMAQTRLRLEHGVADTSKVPVDVLPEPLRTEKVSAGETPVKLALQDAYSLLQAKGDPLGGAFAERRLNDREKSNLQARNASILAHGFEPVGEKVYRNLLADALALAEAAGVSRTQLPQFPRLRDEG
jgi:CRISPR-associated protein (TIGR02710 family)